MNKLALLPLVLLAVASGCAPRAPRIELPARVQADCESRSVKQTAIGSIVASTDDVIRPGTYPGDAAMLKQIKNGGGAIAYWPAQALRLPQTAKALGVDGDYVTLTKAALTNSVNPAGWRPVWLTLKTPGGERTVLERAFDVQNVCIEGTRQA